MRAGLLRHRARQIRLAGSGEALEDQVPVQLDEMTGRQLGQQCLVQPAFFDAAHGTQVGVRIPQLGPADQSVGLGSAEGLVDTSTA